jgi:hypothetical protein
MRATPENKHPDTVTLTVVMRPLEGGRFLQYDCFVDGKLSASVTEPNPFNAVIIPQRYARITCS